MRRQERSAGFTLVELLVVVGIIGLLIGILLPSLGGARRSAKNARIKAQIQSLQQALEMFRNDVGEYPDSTLRNDPTEDSTLIGQTAGDNDPTPSGYQPTDAHLYGAQWLIRGLMGKDLRGYVVPSKSRKKGFDNPATWYDFKPANDNWVEGKGPRETLYLSGEKLTTARVSEITGAVRPQVVTAAPERFQAHVLLDAYERPILYYRAEPRERNRAPNDDDPKKVLCDSTTGPVTGRPIPYYRLSDNELFTGNRDQSVPGWKFATGVHPLEFLGNVVDPDKITDSEQQAGATTTFAKYIHDHRVGGATVQTTGGHVAQQGEHGFVRPYNHETYLLISAGSDGVYGTEDDIKNFGDQ